MRDLLSKLDQLLAETTLQDLKNHPMADDPKIAKAIDDKEQEDPEIGDLEKRYNAERDAERSADLDAQDYWKNESIFQIGDDFGISFTEDFEIGTEIVDILEDGIVIDLDETAINYLLDNGFTFEEGEIVEGKQHGNSKIYDKCWKGHRKVPGKARGEPGSCEKIGESEISEKSFPFAGAAVGHKTGPAGQWRNKGPKANKPARTGDLVGGVSEGNEPDEAYMDRVISDLHKDALGFRPDQEFGREWMSSSFEEKLEIYKNLLKSLHSDMDEGIEEVTGDKKFDDMMKKIQQGIEPQQSDNGFGPSPAGRLSIRSGPDSESEPDPESEVRALLKYNDVETALEVIRRIPDSELKTRLQDMIRQHQNKDVAEAKYQGREVPLGKPMAGDVKKSKVYVRGPKGNVVKVNFGDKKMKIKKSNPKRRKSFRARHNCANPGPRWKARYWSCRAW
jgi:hypothetical protein